MPQVNVPFLNVAYLFQLLVDLLRGQDPAGILHRLLAFIDSLWLYSIIISLIFFVGIVYSIIRLNQIYEEERIKKDAKEAEVESATLDKNPKWTRVLNHINSQNESDWKLAIIECDVILEEMLDKIGYHHGETLSDKLKSVEKSDFSTIDKAWEAHRVRNAVAHEGSEFQINEREARRVVSMYEEVFKEFKFI
jgi:ribosomal protein L14E/L6E/L27E